MRFFIKHIVDYRIEINVNGIEDDESDLVDGFYFERIQLIPLPPINWSLSEIRSIQERSTYVVRRMFEWVKSKRIEATTTIPSHKANTSKDRSGAQGSSSIPTNLQRSNPMVSLHQNISKAGDDGEDLEKGKDLAKACEFSSVIKKKRSKTKGKTMNLAQELEAELECISPQHPPSVDNQQIPFASPSIIISSPQYDDFPFMRKLK